MSMHQIDLFDGADNHVAMIAVQSHASAQRIWARLSAHFDASDYQRSVSAEWTQGDRLILSKRINKHLPR